MAMGTAGSGWTGGRTIGGSGRLSGAPVPGDGRFVVTLHIGTLVRSEWRNRWGHYLPFAAFRKNLVKHLGKSPGS